MAKGKPARLFAIDLKKFGEVTRGRAQAIFIKIALELDQRVVMDTPVLTGRARGNWFPSIGLPSNEVDFLARDPGGTKTMVAVKANILSAKLGQTIWLANNLPYILPLENGYSSKAPQGMVDINIVAIQMKYGGRITR